MKVARVELKEAVVINSPRLVVDGKDGVSELDYDIEDEVVSFVFKGMRYFTSIHGNVKSIAIPANASVDPGTTPTAPAKALEKLAEFPDDDSVDMDKKALVDYETSVPEDGE